MRWLRRRMQRPLIGDDAAVLPAGGPLAVTVDSQVEGIHYLPGLDPARVARRLLAVNLSDLAAMGAEPMYAFLALTAPPGFDHRRFFRALLAACSKERVRLAGGDLSRSFDNNSIATLTLIGRRARGGRWLHRAGAAPGEEIWLGGTVGESAAGRILLAQGARWSSRTVSFPESWASTTTRTAARRAVRRHLTPAPQLRLGAWLAQQRRGAAMDVSDGVARDLRRLCRESGVGASITEESLPLAPGFVALCEALGSAPVELALHGGEDYVLLFTLPAGTVVPARFASHKIGRVTAKPELWITTGQGAGATRRRLPPGGWDHFTSQGQ